MPREAGGGRATIQVWDGLVRLLHWTLAASFLGAYALEDSRDLHETLGWIAVSAVAVMLSKIMIIRPSAVNRRQKRWSPETR
jgi:cytochrome b